MYSHPVMPLVQMRLVSTHVLRAEVEVDQWGLVMVLPPAVGEARGGVA